MAEKSWYVSKDGAQLPGEMDTAAVRALLAAEPGKAILVWAPGMANWAAPATLPEFAHEAAPAATPAPISSAPAPAPRPAASRASMPAGVPTRAELQEHAGAFRSLFDFSFEHLVATKIIRAVYLVIVVLICLGVVGAILAALAAIFTALRFGSVGSAIGSIVLALVAPLIGLVYLAMFRVSLEVVIVLFKIKEDVHLLVERKS